MIDPYELYESKELVDRIKALYADPRVRVNDIADILNQEYGRRGIDLRITQSRVESHIKTLVEYLDVEKRPCMVHPSYAKLVRTAVDAHWEKEHTPFSAYDIYAWIHGNKLPRRRRLPSTYQIANVLENTSYYVKIEQQTAIRRDRLLYVVREDKA